MHQVKEPRNENYLVLCEYSHGDNVFSMCYEWFSNSPKRGTTFRQPAFNPEFTENGYEQLSNLPTEIDAMHIQIVALDREREQLERTYFSSNNNTRFDILTALYNLEQDCKRLVADREALLRRHNRLIVTINQLNDTLFEQNEQQAKDRRFNQLLLEDTTRQKSAIKTLQQEIDQTKQSIAHVSSNKTQAEQDLLTTKLWSNHKKREHANACILNAYKISPWQLMVWVTKLLI